MMVARHIAVALWQLNSCGAAIARAASVCASATILFPEIADKFMRVKDHGRAEAALIASYLYDRQTQGALQSMMTVPPPSQST